MPYFKVKKYDIKTRRVLLIEDEAVVREVVTESLEDLGFEKVTPAASGTAALSKMNEDPHGYPVVIVDIFLTDMTAKHLASKFPSAHSVETVLIFSGGGETDFAATRVAFQNIGVPNVHCLKKPASPEMLEEVLS